MQWCIGIIQIINTSFSIQVRYFAIIKQQTYNKKTTTGKYISNKKVNPAD